MPSDQTTPAVNDGFGAVFVDVDPILKLASTDNTRGLNGVLSTTSMEFFDVDDNSLGVFFVPPAPSTTRGLSFLGVHLDQKVLHRVVITSGNAAIDSGASEGFIEEGTIPDIVVMDDFIYGEPVPEPTSLVLLLLAMGAIAGSHRGGRLFC